MSVPSSLAWHELHGDSLLCASQVESTHKIPCKESPLIYKKNQEPPVSKKKLEEQEEALVG